MMKVRDAMLAHPVLAPYACAVLILMVVAGIAQAALT